MKVKVKSVQTSPKCCFLLHLLFFPLFINMHICIRCTMHGKVVKETDWRWRSRTNTICIRGQKEGRSYKYHHVEIVADTF